MIRQFIYYNQIFHSFPSRRCNSYCPCCFSIIRVCNPTFFNNIQCWMSIVNFSSSRCFFSVATNCVGKSLFCLTITKILRYFSFIDNFVRSLCSSLGSRESITETRSSSNISFSNFNSTTIIFTTILIIVYFILSNILLVISKSICKSLTRSRPKLTWYINYCPRNFFTFLVYSATFL